MSLKIKKAFYDTKQAPGDWFDNLSNFPLENKFLIRKDDTTLVQTKHIFFLCMLSSLIRYF